MHRAFEWPVAGLAGRCPTFEKLFLNSSEHNKSVQSIQIFIITFLNSKIKGFLSPGANVIKLFTAVIYHHSMVILSFCVYIAILPVKLLWNSSKLKRYFNPRKRRVRSIAVCFYNIGPSWVPSAMNVLKQGILKGKYHCTIDLMFHWFGLVCFANK